MSFSLHLPRRDLWWWIAPLALLAIAIAARTVIEGDALRDGFINPWLVAAGIDKHVRSWEKPSDHVPVWAELAIQFGK